MRKIVLKILFCCTLFFSLLMACMGCFREPPSDFFPALTAAAATMQSGLSGSPTALTETATQTPISTTEPAKVPGRKPEQQRQYPQRASWSIIGCCLALGENVEIQQIDSSGNGH